MIANRNVQWVALICFIVIFSISLSTIITYGEEEVDQVSVVEEPSNIGIGTDTTDDTQPVLVDKPDEAEVEVETNTEVLVAEENIPENIINSTYAIYFKPDSIDLIGDYLDEIESITSILDSYETLNAIVEGHYNGYPDQYDTLDGKRLSYERAEHIVSLLKNRGIESQKLRIKNYGSTEQLNVDESEVELAKNRRVIVKFFVD